MPKDYETRKPRGFCFIAYEEKKDADEAIEKMNDTEFDGRTLMVLVSTFAPAYLSIYGHMYILHPLSCDRLSVFQSDVILRFVIYHHSDLIMQNIGAHRSPQVSLNTLNIYIYILTWQVENILITRSVL